MVEIYAERWKYVLPPILCLQVSSSKYCDLPKLLIHHGVHYTAPFISVKSLFLEESRLLKICISQQLV